jgi:ABC-type Fe3+ transport system permease subunit
MSVAEIQDNKWELEATKPPLKSPASIGIIIMMGGFALFFVAVIIGAVVGSFTDTEEMNFEKVQREAPAE